ncbi:hypothetical protein ACN2XU_01010 [Primorskyibacter sp. 2E107]|uniref:hypothetical protein n=1 Tax=Primorskyibacter sp. 2E107 TaxID=3403458 RepID=UPI003AF4E071
MQLIIHAGFHKTGTSTVQATLLKNREALSDHVTIFLRDDILPMVKAARRFSIRRDSASLDLFSSSCAAWLSNLEERSTPMIIATEDIAGAMPGRAGVADYSALPIVMGAFETAARKRFGDVLDLTIYLSTRAPDHWIESLWWQHLRSTRFATSLEEYRDEAARAAMLPNSVAAVRDSLRTGRVVTHALEDLKTMPEGLMSPIYQLLDLPASKRVLPLKAMNQRPDLGLEPVFLALNRSGLPDDLVSQTKRKLLRAVRQRSE